MRTRSKGLRKATCFSLKIPMSLSCPKCERYIKSGIDKRKKNNCQQPWDSEKWGNHRELKYVQRYHKICNYLNLNTAGDEVYDDYKYGPNRLKYIKITIMITNRVKQRVLRCRP